MKRAPANRAAIHAPDAGHLTMGERLADRAASSIGSWRFVIAQSLLTVAWVVLNTVAFTGHWDPYPWILLNLCYSFQAGFTGPILLLANNRQAAKDRAMAARDDLEIGRLNDLQTEQMAILNQQTAILTEGRSHNAWTREQIEALNETLAELRDALPSKSRARTNNPHVDHPLPEVGNHAR